MKKTSLALLAFALLAPLLVRAANAPQQFTLSSMEINGTARDRVVCDLNGDRKKDLLMVYTKANEEEKSHIAVFLQKADSGFPSSPSFDAVLPSDFRSFDCGDVAEPAGDEVVALRDGGVFYFDKSDGKLGKLEPLISTATIFKNAEYHNPARQHFLVDYDLDGKSEVLMPEISGPAIYKKAASGKWEVLQKAKLPAQLSYKIGSWGDVTHTDDINQFLRFRTYMKRTAATYTVPDLFVEDFNGDKKMDLIAILGNDLWVFCQEANGKLPDKPSLHFEKSVLTADEKKTGFMGEMLTFLDLNGDGIDEIIKVKYGSVEQRVNIQYMIYFGKPGLVYSKTPDQKISSAGFRADFGAYDMRNTGKRDIVVPFFHFAPAQAFKMLTENAVKVQFRLFLMGNSGRYDQDPKMDFAKPNDRIQIPYRINVLGIIMDPEAMIKGEFNPLVNFGNDVNGDGFPDLVADSGADVLNIYYGNNQAKYNVMTPSQSIPLESAWSFDFNDLNFDKKMDVITYYESEERVKEKKKAMEDAKRAQAGPVKGGEPSSAEEEELMRIAAAKEQTRIKIIIWK
jgi:hypothetical protein